ncbi:hypothetical protein TWF281_002735 [Arthrobotrys megalospora]
MPNNHSLTIPSSPPLLPSSASPSLLPQPPPLTGQKRFLDIDPSSDDIPVFSSDDLPPKEVFENPYQAYRRSARTVKRQRSGTIQSILKHRAEVTFLSSDLVDDGLPNSSSSSSKSKPHDWSEDYNHDGDDEEANTSLSTIRPPASEPDLPSDVITDLLLEEDLQDTEANLIIQKAIENGSEVVDLSNLALTQVPTDISSLSSLILQPKDSLPSSSSQPFPKSTPFLRSSSGIDPTVSSPYTSLRPKIHLHLHHNSLTALPRSLTSLQTITGLYLRKNLLRSLPHHISNLTSLTHLSIGENLLAYLPFSLLSLQHLTPTAGLSFFPNPFFAFKHQDTQLLPKKSLINQDDSEIRDSDPTRLPKSAHGVATSNPTPAFIKSTITKHFIYNFISSTPLSAFNDLGQLVTSPLTETIEYPTQWPTLTKRGLKDSTLPLLSSRQPKPKKQCITSKFPSLQELCLRKMATDVMYTSLKQAQREDVYRMLPGHLRRKVREVLEGGEGVKKCTVCKGDYVMKGVEWIEFWEVIPCDDGDVEYSKPDVVERILKDVMGKDGGEMEWDRFLKRFLGRRGDGKGNVVPLLREGCSWECAEVWMGQREEAEEEGY